MTEPRVSLPAVPEPAPEAAHRRPRDVFWLVVPAASGVVLGVLWWLLAPGGLNLVSGNPDLADPANTESWLPRDLVLAALMLVAGIVTGLMLDGKLQGVYATRRLVLALLGGAVGAVIAWLAGLLAAQWWGPAQDPAVDPAFGFTLRSYAVLVLWPGATAFITFVLALFGVLSKKPVK
ncbi:hypothetical protein FQP90_19805 [Paenarthrobacter nitroguajacolicus]|uniref:ABC transporter permease n=1 Tax=Paenarthrobacter nitroguajacolicus TaxID=211146 RepID=A0A558GQH2_PAENT|nr:hypothetical protein [Paenarthrobacter nitroguajacolicus]TVU59066.1 hypothetical protein FQP90_19805 [Paenarthrobacter nitroguajacolicus]